VTSNRIKNHAAVVSGTAKVGGALAAEARIRFMIVEARRMAAGFDRCKAALPMAFGE
jgi:hypothetical protein